jgi:hypothetical protein
MGITRPLGRKIIPHRFLAFRKFQFPDMLAFVFDYGAIIARRTLNVIKQIKNK